MTYFQLKLQTRYQGFSPQSNLKKGKALGVRLKFVHFRSLGRNLPVLILFHDFLIFATLIACVAHFRVN